MEESPVTTHKSRTRLSANKHRKSKATPNKRVSKVKQEPESPIIGTPPSYLNSISSTPTLPKDLNVSTPRDEDDYRNHEIYTSSPFTVASSQMPLPGKEVFWNFDTPQAKKLREKMKAEASPVLPEKKMSMPRQRMQIAKSRREPVVSTEESERCQEVFEEFLALCKPINTSTAQESDQVQIKTEDRNVDELEMKFQQSSMSPKMKGVVEIKNEQSTGNDKNEIKTEMESIGSDMFGDDMENVSELFENNIVDSVEGDGSDLFKDDSDIPEVKNENEPCEPMHLDEVEKNKIVKMSTSALFEDDDDSLLLQCTQAAESEVKQEHQPIIKTENQVEISINAPGSVINAKSNLQSKPIIKPFETKEANSVNQMKKPFTMPHKAVSASTKPVSSATSSATSGHKPFNSTKPTIPFKDITSLIQPNKPVNPAIETLAAEDDFGEDDSFDMLMSQMSEEDVLQKAPAKNQPMSPVLSSKSSKRRKCFQLDKPPGVATSPVLRNPVVPKHEPSFKRFKSADDMDTRPPTKASSLSVRRIQSSPSIPLYQMPKPAATSTSTATARTRQASGPAQPSSVVQASLRPSNAGQASLRPTSVSQLSQGNNFAPNKRTLGATVKPTGPSSTSVKPTGANSSTVKPSGANYTSVKAPVANSVYGNPPGANSTTAKPPVFKCTKEDIDRKRMEALRKRQQSQNSQK